MSIRKFLMLIVCVPLLVLSGAKVAGIIIPVPEWGRDYVLRIPVAAPSVVAQPLQLPEILGPEDETRPLIVLDAGHGGRDPGAVSRLRDGTEVFEKDIALALTLELRDRLLAQGGVRVALTRDSDRLVPLAYRPEIARLLDADLFLSIHADSAGELSEVSGASIYTLSNEASSEAAARFADRENAADRLNGIIVEGQSEVVSDILVELSQQRIQEEASEFSSLIAREGDGVIAFHPEARRSAALAVLRAPDVPGVLFESGFVTNEEDLARLITQDGRGAYADVLARGIRVYFARQSNR